jgi:hypothetical protein
VPESAYQSLSSGSRETLVACPRCNIPDVFQNPLAVETVQAMRYLEFERTITHLKVVGSVVKGGSARRDRQYESSRQ